MDNSREFLEKAQTWIEDGYDVDILYVAYNSADGPVLLNCFVIINPLVSHKSSCFQVEARKFIFGHQKIPSSHKIRTIDILNKSIAGQMETNSIKANLPNFSKDDSYSRMDNRDSYFSPLHILLQGKLDFSFSTKELALVDHALRVSSPPFDGISDALGHLGLANVIDSQERSYIEILINPPVDLNIEQCSLHSNRLTISLLSHKNFDTNKITLTVKAMPSLSLSSRINITSNITWKQNGAFIGGYATIDLPESKSATLMLSIENHTIRRHWINDNSKTSNIRHLSLINSDQKLAKTKSFIFDNADPRDFEKGIANLFFLHGFSPCQPADTNAPDLIVQTPNGRIILIECTLRIADFSTKLGKLVDRKGALKKAFISQEVHLDPIAILVCRLNIDQIAVKPDELKLHQTLLFTYDDIDALFKSIQYPISPDTFIDSKLKQLNDSSVAL